MHFKYLIRVMNEKTHYELIRKYTVYNCKQDLILLQTNILARISLERKLLLTQNVRISKHGFTVIHDSKPHYIIICFGLSHSK